MISESWSIFFAVVFGFCFGILAGMIVFNNMISIELESKSAEPVYYTVEALTDEMEIEWVSNEEEGDN